MRSQVEKMAMFPLKTFLLPGEEIPLKIFEQRYIQLITDAEKNGMRFGIPYIEDDTISSYGSEVELLSIVAKNRLNEMVVLVKCIRNFHLLDFYEELPGKLYGGGIIEHNDDTYQTTSPKLIVLAKKLQLDLDPIMGTFTTKNAFNLFDIAKALLLKSDDKHAFYALRSQKKMEFYLYKQLKFYELIKKNEEVLQKNFSLN